MTDSQPNSARLCDKNGTFFRCPFPNPTPSEPADTVPENPWSPFQDRLAFDWAQYHFVQLQSSESEILTGLDLWRATVIKHGSKHDDIPWHNAQDLYETIDSIQAGEAPWKTFTFSYSGPKPPTPPRWMEETYELNTRNVLTVLEQQLATTEFDGQFETTPYREFNAQGDRVYSNLMSGHWAYREAVRFLLN
jgi:hypothetical protein